ncbi:MAG: amidohydrolase [Deltaproteobacteria bacterium]|jgi:predicted amidohydrolase YtcJ|nr:amidohydrolase [Deltaproteobacteria bacterium]
MTKEAREGGRLFFNGRFHTLDETNPLAGIVAAKGDTAVYVGDDFREALDALKRAGEPRPGLAAGPDDGVVRETDLKHRAVIPGLIDAHAHVLHEGMRLSQPDVFGLTYEGALEALGREAKKLPPGAFLHARGWDHNLYPGMAWPEKEDLDRVCPDNPAVVDRVDKHSVWVNSLFLKLAGIDENTPDPPGGEIKRDPATGKPSGILVGRAIHATHEHMAPWDGRDPLETFLEAEREFLSFGVTTVIDCGTRKNEFLLLDEAYAKGIPKIRFRAFVVADPWEEELLKDGPRRGLRGERLSLDGVKIFSDGSLGSQSAWLTEDYADRPGHRGDHNYDDQSLAGLMEKIRDRGLQAAIHVIGDAAVDQAVRVMGKVLGKDSKSRRWRLEHCQMFSEKALAEAVALGLIPSIQGAGLMTDLHMVGRRLGEARLPRTYNWKTILKAGSILLNGSDAPIETPNPFHGIYAAMERKDLKGLPPGGYLPEERLTLTEALLSYTKWPARAAFAENRLGSISPSKLCDFTVLDRDIFDVSPGDIADTRPLLTVVGGEEVYADKGWD